MRSALDDEIDRKWPLPAIPFIGDLHSHALQRTYEASRIQHRRLYPGRDGKEEAKCPARGPQLPHRWANDGMVLTSCVFCGAAHG